MIYECSFDLLFTRGSLSYDEIRFDDMSIGVTLQPYVRCPTSELVKLLVELRGALDARTAASSTWIEQTFLEATRVQRQVAVERAIAWCRGQEDAASSPPEASCSSPEWYPTTALHWVDVQRCLERCRNNALSTHRLMAAIDVVAPVPADDASRQELEGLPRMHRMLRGSGAQRWSAMCVGYQHFAGSGYLVPEELAVFKTYLSGYVDDVCGGRADGRREDSTAALTRRMARAVALAALEVSPAASSSESIRGVIDEKRFDYLFRSPPRDEKAGRGSSHCDRLFYEPEDYAGLSDEQVGIMSAKLSQIGFGSSAANAL